MFNFINKIGIFGMPLVIIAFTILGLTVRNTIKLRGEKADPAVDINVIIFLGVFALVLGFFSHFLGMYQAADIMGQMPPGMIVAGYAQSLRALLYGFGIFFISAFCWMGLRWKARLLQRSAS